MGAHESEAGAPNAAISTMPPFLYRSITYSLSPFISPLSLSIPPSLSLSLPLTHFFILPLTPLSSLPLSIIPSLPLLNALPASPPLHPSLFMALVLSPYRKRWR